MSGGERWQVTIYDKVAVLQVNDEEAELEAVRHPFVLHRTFPREALLPLRRLSADFLMRN